MLHLPIFRIGDAKHFKSLILGSGSKGKIARVTQDDNAFDCTVRIEGSHVHHGGCWIHEYNYLVLDGYQPEPEKEPEPEYYNGKVVCVSSGDACFTVGKMYEFVNGEVKDDEGDARPMHADERFKSVEEWNSECGMPIARFIEFKGEAHD